MAQANNTVDPNDLDSIDALLDEAELEAAPEEPKAEQTGDAGGVEGGGLSDMSDDELPDDWSTEDDAPSSEGTIEDPTAGLLDELDEEIDSADISAEETPVEAPEPEPVKEADQPDVPTPKEQPGLMEQALDSQPLEKNAEAVLEKRAQAQKASQNTMKDADMDGLKKLIITFSSIIITLVVVTIGIGIWAALSSGPGLSKETLDKIDGIEANSTQSLMHTNQSNKTLKTLDKKLDALSFQLEQLNGDIAKMEVGAPKVVAKAEVVPEKESAQEKAKVAANPKVEAVESKIVQASPELTAKLDKVGRQMTAAQRRIYEINRRVKQLQGQYKVLLRSIKTVEKQLIVEKVEKTPVKKATTSAKKVPAHDAQQPQTKHPSNPPLYQEYKGYRDDDAYSY